jgi:hypothetical protein
VSAIDDFEAEVKVRNCVLLRSAADWREEWGPLPTHLRTIDEWCPVVLMRNAVRWVSTTVDDRLLHEMTSPKGFADAVADQLERRLYADVSFQDVLDADLREGWT